MSDVLKVSRDWLRHIVSGRLFQARGSATAQSPIVDPRMSRSANDAERSHRLGSSLATVWTVSEDGSCPSSWQPIVIHESLKPASQRAIAAKW